MKTIHIFKIHILLLAILLLAGVAGCSNGSSEEISGSVQLTSTVNTPPVSELLASLNMYQFKNPAPAPDFELESVTGSRVSLSQYRGKVILLNFWATW